MTYTQMLKLINEHNTSKGIRQQYQDKQPLHFVIVFKSSNWKEPYTEQERSYKVRSDNKAFLPDMCGGSLYGDCLDGLDHNVRLDWYNWEIENIYQVEQ